MTEKKSQSFFQIAFSSCVKPLRRAALLARRRRHLFTASVRIREIVSPERLSLAERYHFLGCCASLYDLYGFVPRGYVKDAAKTILAARMAKKHMFSPGLHLEAH